MKQVVATALVLLLTLFLLPLLLLGEEPLAGPSQPPAATGTLPIDRTVVTPGQTADGPASGSSPSRSSGNRNRVSSSTRAVATTCSRLL